MWLGKERKEEGTTSTSFHLSLKTKRPSLHASTPFSPISHFQHPFPTHALLLHTFFNHIF